MLLTRHTDDLGLKEYVGRVLIDAARLHNPLLLPTEADSFNNFPTTLEEPRKVYETLIVLMEQPKAIQRRLTKYKRNPDQWTFFLKLDPYAVGAADPLVDRLPHVRAS